MINSPHTQFALLTALLLPSALCAQDDADPQSRMLYSLKADGTARTQIHRTDYFQIIASPAVSPDATRLAFSSWNLQDGESRNNSFIYFLDNFQTLATARSTGDGAMPSWSPRGKRVAVTRFAPNKGVWVMKSDGTDKRLLDRSGRNARWSPNGHMIAYVKSVNGVSTIAFYNMVEDQSFDLWNDSVNPFSQFSDSFAWSPDSRQICFRARRANEDGNQEQGQSEIVIVNVYDESQLKVRHTCQDGRFPTVCWHPEESRIVFSKSPGAGKPGQLYWCDPTSDDEPQWFPGQYKSRDNSNPCWTPDGSRMIFVSGPAGESEQNVVTETKKKSESIDD